MSQIEKKTIGGNGYIVEFGESAIKMVEGHIIRDYNIKTEYLEVNLPYSSQGVWTKGLENVRKFEIIDIETEIYLKYLC